MIALPIDDVMPAVIAAVRERGTCVLVAAPGAGKTTRVPGALVDAGLVEGEVIVLQPRRIAARLAAARVASERGGELGGEVGYEIRFDRRVSAATRIKFVTEGVLTRRLLADPELRGVGCVVIDEFHERHLDGDLALALCARLRERRPELRLIVMSATLDAAPVAAFLGDAPVVESAGRAFPLAIEYSELAVDDRPLGKQVAAAVRRAAQTAPGGKLDGDVLVFLPGAGEIRRVGEDLEEVARVFDLAILPLHGDLTADEQDAAVRRGARTKVILATNVAETSVTIDGVTTVIDSGLARIARHSPWSGLPSLQVEPVSRASCAQRAGRAGRTRPGRAIRLYTKHDHDLRRAFEVPEIARADLAGAALELYGAGLAGLTDLRWFEPPPAAAASAADELLARLGAITASAASPASPASPASDASTASAASTASTASAASAASTASTASPRITPLGRKMLRFPLHPRQARLACDADDRGVGGLGAALAALLGARELRLERRGPTHLRQARVASSSDLLDDLDIVVDSHAPARDVDRGTLDQVRRVARQLNLRDARSLTADAEDDQLLQAILAAFPDRVARRRAPRSLDFTFAGGGGGTLAPASSVIDAEWIVAVDVAETGARGAASRVSIRRASAIDPTWLLAFEDRITERDELAFDADKQRVVRITAVTYDGLVVDDTRAPAPPSPAAATLLAREALAAGIARFVDPAALAEWRARVTLAASLVPAITPPTDDNLAALIARACEDATSFADLRAQNLLALLDASLGEHRATVARLAPTHLALPRRGRVAIHYAPDQPPWIESRMQDFFGLARAPAVGDGRVPLVLHLLAPNQRAVQVTQDLPGFWVRHYPALRKQLMRRYPRHQWPEDPTQLVVEE